MTRVAGRAPLLAQDDGGPRRPFVQLRRQLRGDLAGHPAELLAAVAVHGDRIGVMGIARVAAQLEPTPRLRGVGRYGVGMVLARARYADHPKPPPGQLRGVACEVAP